VCQSVRLFRLCAYLHCRNLARWLAAHSGRLQTPAQDILVLSVTDHCTAHDAHRDIDFIHAVEVVLPYSVTWVTYTTSSQLNQTGISRAHPQCL